MANQHEFTEDILDSLGEGVFTVDKSFRINFFNRAAEEITGYRREEIYGRFCKHIFQSTLCNDACPIARILEGEERVDEVNCRIRDKQGSGIPIKLNAALLKNQHSDEPMGGVVSFRDLSRMEIHKHQTGNHHSYYGIVARSKAMQEIFQLIEDIAESDAGVIIQGESGTGKELIANAIQLTSPRKNKPYVKINCSVFSPQLLASELFGHVKGAFTGAIKDRQGRFEMAHSGTLFLDEIGEMAPEMQVQLLRVLQEGTFERVGESLTRQADVRIIAATNMDIARAISDGRFREDLYYRLNVINIEIPPLRERPGDVRHLAEYFLQKFNRQSRKQVNEIDRASLDMLLSYQWPGNVRELENAIECAVARCKTSTLSKPLFPPQIRNTNNQKAFVSHPEDLTENSSAEVLIQLLDKHQWNRTKVARALNIGRTTLWRKMKALGID